jgi:hypothetical protein
MDFRIADTFIEDLMHLTGEEQKTVNTAALDLRLNPAQPSLQLHRVDTSKDRNFWSARVNLDLRLIVHRTDSRLLLCFVHHHDEALRPILHSSACLTGTAIVRCVRRNFWPLPGCIRREERRTDLMARNFEELVKRMLIVARDRAEAQAARLIAEYALGELREARSMTKRGLLRSLGRTNQ